MISQVHESCVSCRMIERIRFQNFKVLKNAELKLGPFNVIVGPNGSGKSTALQGLESLAEPQRFQFRQLVTTGSGAQEVTVDALWNPQGHPDTGGAVWSPTQPGVYRA